MGDEETYTIYAQRAAFAPSGGQRCASPLRGATHFVRLSDKKAVSCVVGFGPATQERTKGERKKEQRDSEQRGPFGFQPFGHILRPEGASLSESSALYYVPFLRSKTPLWGRFAQRARAKRPPKGRKQPFGHILRPGGGCTFRCSLSCVAPLGIYCRLCAIYAPPPVSLRPLWAFSPLGIYCRRN